MEFETLCLHADGNKKDEWGTLTAPICQSATFVHKNADGPSAYSYSRLANPTRAHLENTVAAIESGKAAFAFSSGMAAISTVIKLFAPSAHIIATNDLYGGSLRLFNNVMTKDGLTFDFVDTSDVASVGALINENTAAIYCESPSNPLMQVSDISALSVLARKNDIMLIVDNTFLTPYYQRPLKLGADIVIHSGTKYLGGHNDVLAGFAVASDAEICDKLAYLYKTFGACLAPLDCFLVERGIKTLALRMRKITENARLLAAWLKRRSDVKKVYYAGIGGMISFEVTSSALAVKILKDVEIFQYAESLGGVDSLITYPIRQTHADVPEAERNARGINDAFLRISVGIENIDDLINDLEAAFDK